MLSWFSSSPRLIDRLRLRALSGEDLRVERLLAAGRAFLAVASLAAIWLDPTEPSRYAALAYGLLVAYAAYSLLLLALLGFLRELSSRFRLPVHAVDMLWPPLIALFTTGPNSPFFLFNVFVLLAAAYRWGMRETLATAGATVVLFFSQALLMVSGPGYLRLFLSPWEFELNRFLMRGIYLLIMGYLLGYLAEGEKLLRAEAAETARIIGRVQEEIRLHGALRVLFDEILELLGAAQALLVLREMATGRGFLWEARRDASPSRLAVALTELDTTGRARYLFETPGEAWAFQRRAGQMSGGARGLLVLDRDGAPVRDAAWTPPDDFVRAHDFRALLGIAVTFGEEWSGTLLVFNPQPVADRETTLRFLQALTHKVSPAIFNVFLRRRLRSRVGAAERARVARELHDGVIQSLIGLEMQVDVLRRQAGAAGGPWTEEMGRVQQCLKDEILNLRELMQQMRPLDLGPRQLLEFLADTVERFRRETGIAASFVSGLEEVRLPPRVCTEMARIVQEALVNVRKHSGARNVLVRFEARDGVWTLVVDDDGRGFDFSGRLEQAELDAARKGPLVIKERVRSIGGQLAVESVPGRGARLEVSLPQKRYG